MDILVTNDDGYSSPGVANLAVSVREFGEVHVVAPQTDKSGSSCSITLDRPLRVGKAQTGFTFVNGTPVDCVNLAVTSLLSNKPDLVLSGINNGRNIAEDVHYSGTVGAAIEGYLHGITSIAFSLDSSSFKNLATANLVVKKIIKGVLDNPFSSPKLLNVNIPDVTVKELSGFRVCRPARRKASQPALVTESPKGEKVFWVGSSGDFYDVGRETDHGVLKEKFASVSSLTTGMYSRKEEENIDSWLERIS